MMTNTEARLIRAIEGVESELKESNKIARATYQMLYDINKHQIEEEQESA